MFSFFQLNLIFVFLCFTQTTDTKLAHKVLVNVIHVYSSIRQNIPPLQVLFSHVEQQHGRVPDLHRRRQHWQEKEEGGDH